jgi:hypothetical protein
VSRSFGGQSDVKNLSNGAVSFAKSGIDLNIRCPSDPNSKYSYCPLRDQRKVGTKTLNENSG